MEKRVWYADGTHLKAFVSIFLGITGLLLAGPGDAARADSENPYFARAWTSEDGLPENNVVGLAQTPDGLLWVATQGGLVRFDGVRFQPFEAAITAGFVTRTMRLLYLDRENRLWLAKEGGVLVCLDGTTVRTLTPKDGLPALDAGQRSLAEDGEGSLWISYSLGQVVRVKHGEVTQFSAQDGLPTGGVALFCTDRAGRLWFEKNGRAGVFRDGKFVTLLDLSPHAIGIAPASLGGIWICVNRQVMRFSEGGEPVPLAELPDSQNRLDPTVLLEDHEGAVWVGTAADGLFRCDTNGVTGAETTYPAISSLVEDRAGNLWVGTLGGGLNRVQPRAVSLIGPATGLPFDEGVRSVCQDASGALWAVGRNGMVVRQEGQKWSVPNLGQPAADIRSWCVAAEPQGAVWIGTYRGALLRWKDGRTAAVDYGVAAHRGGIRALLVAKSGDLWLAADSLSTNNFLCRLRDGQVQKFDLPPGYRLVRALTEDADGNIWAGGSDGLLVRVTGDVLEDETAKFPKYSIRCLHGTPDGSVWIGYAGFGVGRYQSGRLARFSADQGLPNDYVSQIQEDGLGGMWFAGNQGVFQVRRQEFDNLATGRATQLQPVLYGRSKGLPNLQATFDYSPNAVNAGNGKLYFSMLTGLAQVQPERVRPNRLPPTVIMERVVADGRTLAAYQAKGLPPGTNAAPPQELAGADRRLKITLPAGFEHLQFEFTALNYGTPEDVQFRYRLEGLDGEWVDAGTRRTAEYPHLPPGEYRFRVSACNNDHIWSENGAVLPLVLEPQLWETIWFKLLAALAAFGLGAGILVTGLRRRHRRQILRLEQMRTLERERARIARDLHDDLGIGLTEIGLLGDLGCAPLAAPETSRGYMQEITDRARELVVLLDEIVWAINPVNDTSQSLSDYFFIYAQTILGRASIRCRLEVIQPFPNYGLNAEERHQLFLAFKESLNNVIRHSRATEVKISLALQDGRLLIHVADNGRGPENDVIESSRDGVKGMQERLARLGGRCEIARDPAGGMSVKLFIPVGDKTKL